MPVASASCYLAAPASLLPGAADAGGLAYSDAAAVCAQLAPLAVPARVRSAAEAAYVVGRRCGVLAPTSGVVDDGFGVWMGLVASTANASQRSRAVGWGFGAAPYTAAAEPPDEPPAMQVKSCGLCVGP